MRVQPLVPTRCIYGCSKPDKRIHEDSSRFQGTPRSASACLLACYDYDPTQSSCCRAPVCRCKLCTVAQLFTTKAPRQPTMSTRSLAAASSSTTPFTSTCWGIVGAVTCDVAGQRDGGAQTTRTSWAQTGLLLSPPVTSNCTTAPLPQGSDTKQSPLAQVAHASRRCCHTRLQATPPVCTKNSTVQPMHCPGPFAPTPWSALSFRASPLMLTPTCWGCAAHGHGAGSADRRVQSGK